MLGAVVNPDEHFFIDFEKDISLFHTKLTKGALVLVHGPPGCGKSSLAMAIRRKHPYTKERAARKERSYVYIAAHHFIRALQTNTFDSELTKHLNKVENLNGDLPKDYLPATALGWLAERNVAVIVDEAHVIFDTEKSPKLEYIYSAFLKNPGFTALFLTSSSDTTVAELSGSASLIETTPTSKQPNHSPSQMTLKLFWSGEFDAESAARALGMTRVKLSFKAIEAVVQISGLNRSVCTSLCLWVEQKQQRDKFSEVFLYFVL